MKWILGCVCLFVIGCAVGSFPSFPSKVTHQYTVDIRNKPVNNGLLKSIVNREDIPEFEPMTRAKLLESPEPADMIVRCLKFEIVSQAPYKIKYVGLVDLSICNGVTGFKPEDAISVYNWMDDVYSWAEDRKKCFK